MAFRDRIKEFRRVPASELAANPRNWRTHPKAQHAALSAVLEEVGFAGAAVARETDDGLELIDGHLRRDIGHDQEIPTLVVDVTEEEATKLLATFDPISAMAEADAAMLRDVLDDVQTSDEALAGMLDDLAKDAGILEPTEIEEDEAPEPPDDPVTQPGDLWQLGPHRLLCGDSTDPGGVARLLGGAEPFIMVTDPPYGVEYDPSWNDGGIKAERGRAREDPRGKVENDNRDDWEEAYALCTGPVAYVWCASKGFSEVERGLNSCGFEVRAAIIWNKNRFAIARAGYHWKHETAQYAVRKGSAANWTGDRKQTTLWQIANKDQDAETVHGTQKPVECMRRPILNNSSPGQAVYEPFMGSGTTLIAAETTGRVCLGIELNPAYVDVAVQRWQQFTGQKALLDSEGLLFDEVRDGREAA